MMQNGPQNILGEFVDVTQANIGILALFGSILPPWIDCALDLASLDYVYLTNANLAFMKRYGHRC